MTMDIKIETATVTANPECSLKGDWTFEMGETVHWQPAEIQAQEVGEILMKEILKDDE